MLDFMLACIGFNIGLNAGFNYSFNARLNAKVTAVYDAERFWSSILQ